MCVYTTLLNCIYSFVRCSRSRSTAVAPETFLRRSPSSHFLFFQSFEMPWKMSHLFLRFLLLTGSVSYARLINSEIVKDVSVYLCSHVPTYSHANMNVTIRDPFHSSSQIFSFSPTRYNFVLHFVLIREYGNSVIYHYDSSFYDFREEIRDLQSTTSLQSRIQISWRQLATANSCRLTFKGYQTEYRISPDLGGYETCQTSISRHLFKLSQGMNMGIEHQKRIEFNSTNQDCPILNVPTAYPVRNVVRKFWKLKCSGIRSLQVHLKWVVPNRMEVNDSVRDVQEWRVR